MTGLIFSAPPPPQEGELVLFCEHADIGDGRIHLSRELSPFHWYIWLTDEGGPGEVTLPDGTGDQFRWIAICRNCNQRCGKKLDESLVKKHSRWFGAAPVIFPEGERN
jgi:hypothetical protein